MYLVKVSPGELIDRLTILRVKERHLSDGEQLKLVKKDIQNLSEHASKLLTDPRVRSLAEDLYRHNEAMWQAMQKIYDWTGERTGEFPTIVLSIIDVNKERAYAKRSIDILLESEIMEAKSFFEGK